MDQFVIVNGITHPTTSLTVSMNTFQEIEQDYTSDCFVPIVVSTSSPCLPQLSSSSACRANATTNMQAIYTVLIIALITLNQSPIDIGFSQPATPESPAARRGGVMTSTIVFHHLGSTGDGSSSSADATSIEGAMEVRHGGLRGSPSSRVVLDKDEDQKEKGAELALQTQDRDVSVQCM